MQPALSITAHPEVVVKVVLVTSAMLLTAVDGVMLDGSPNSHARFPTWIPRCPSTTSGSNWTATLSFDFETRRASCLVLYADNGHEFVVIHLVRGTSRLRLDGGRTLTVGSGLNDGRTHSVELSLTAHLATLTVDRSSQHFTLVPPSPSPVSSSASTGDFSVFVGGLPVEFRSGQRLEQLAAPSVAFEPTFVGSVRNMAYTTRCDDDDVDDVLRMTSGSGVRSGVDDSCADYDPCQNAAPCLNTDEGPLCDCSFTGYVGPFCDLGQRFSFIARLSL